LTLTGAGAATFASTLTSTGLLTASSGAQVSDGSASSPSVRFVSEATGLFKAGTAKLGFAVAGLTSMVLLKNPDGNPVLGPESANPQMSFGDPAYGGFVLVNGTNYGTDKGDVLVTGRSGGTGPGVGDVLIRSYDGTNTYVNATFKAGGEVNVARSGLTVGAPTGGDKGVGKINVAGDIYKNNTAYNNPDYVFETAYEGTPRSPAPEGYRIRPLAEVEQFTKEHLHLPGISREASGMFARGDMLLEKVEELFLHAFDQQRQLRSLAAENQLLREQMQALRSPAAVPA